MKLFQASFDTVFITVIAEDKQDAMLIIYEDNNNYLKDNMFIEDGKLYMKWSDDYTEQVEIRAVKEKRGIIQYESH